MDSVVKVKTGNRFEDSVSYSRAVAVGDTIYVANTAGRDHASGELPEAAAAQAELALRHIQASLAPLGASLADIVQLTAHIPNPADVESVTAVLGDVFRDIDPAMTIVCTPLAGAYKVEFDTFAHRGVGDAHATYVRVSLT